jgi:hypothetical protein
VRPAALTRVRSRTPWVRVAGAIPPIVRAATFECAGCGGGWQHSSELGGAEDCE